MKKNFVFLGDGGSGKTTLITELATRHPDKFKRVVTCTSRPMRSGEVDGRDYHFFPKEFFIDNPSLVLVKQPEAGACYGTIKRDLYSDTHHLLLASKPSGLPKLVQAGFSNLVAVRIDISTELKIERMRQRGDSEEEISSRLVQDDLTRGVDLCGVPVIEVKAEQCLDEQIEVILLAAND